MSWTERLSDIKFTIKTGDGKTYEPLWKNGEKGKDFNVSKYDFIDVDKSFVDRKQPQSNKYPLVFYFQGSDNIEQCDAFEESANDNRAWTIEHPFYGTIKGQPINLKRNDSSYNVTEVTVEFWESITDDYPLSDISIPDEVVSRVNNLKAVGLAMLVENSSPQTSDIVTVKDTINNVSSKHTPDAESYNDYNNIVKTALTTADNLVSDIETAFSNAQDVVLAPANFIQSINDKIDSYVDSYNSLKESINSLFDKYYFESQAAGVLAGMCLCAVNPQEDDYIVRSDIESINDLITATYEDYLATLDELQVEIYNIDDTWSPNSVIQSALISLVAFSSNGLFNLSFDARQERQFELTSDSNLIILTHRFLGLDANDNNINIFRKINGIKNNELYKIRKGRTIKYFV